MSALLDAQLSAKETEEAWSHVYSCHACRDLVEREGWVKTRLAGLSTGERTAPSNLKGSLLSMPPGDAILAEADAHEGLRRHVGAAAIGGGAIGAAMLGVLALGLASGSAPPAERRPPASQINTAVPERPSSPAPNPALRGGISSPSGTATVVPVPLRRMLP